MWQVDLGVMYFGVSYYVIHLNLNKKNYINEDYSACNTLKFFTPGIYTLCIYLTLKPY